MSRLKQSQNAVLEELILGDVGKPTQKIMEVHSNEIDSINLTLNVTGKSRMNQNLSVRWNVNSKEYKSRTSKLKAERPEFASMSRLNGIAAWKKRLRDEMAVGMMVEIGAYDAINELCICYILLNLPIITVMVNEWDECL